jgi:hypothetical protein
MSDSETTDLSDKNCTGEELDSDHFNNLPKVVSQSTGVGGLKRPVNSVDPIDLKRPKHDEVKLIFYEKVDSNLFIHLVPYHGSYCCNHHNNSRYE